MNKYDPTKWPMKDSPPELNQFDIPMWVAKKETRPVADVEQEYGLRPGSLLSTEDGPHKDSLERPACVSPAAKQAVELAVFDLCEIAKRLQEWRGA